jgi:hypothetical protein
MSARNLLPGSFEDRRSHQQIRDFAHTLDATSHILKAAGFRLHKLRDVVDALQGIAGGRREFDCSHRTLARRLEHGGKDETADAYAARKVAALEKEQLRIGVELFTIERGGGIEHKRTHYTDNITAIANRAMQRARESELWKENPGKALESQMPEAVKMLPPVAPDESENSDGPDPVPAGVRIARNRSHVLSRARANFEIIAESGGDIVAHAQSLANDILERAYLIAQGATVEEQDDAPQSFDPSDWKVEPPQICDPSLENPSKTEEKVSKLGAALMYAARGMRVFPCQDKGKEPRIKEWQNLATTDEATIQRWWHRWPDANVAIATGAGSNLFVLDVDFEKGGDASLCTLIEAHGDLETARVQTGAGLHFYFQHPGREIRNNAGRLGEGLDGRGDGGYVIAPPSVHPNGSCYEWLKVKPVAVMQEWLLKLLTEERRAVASTSTTKGHVQGKSGAGMGAVIPEGERNESLFRIGCAVRGQGAEYDEIESSLLDANATRCAPPLPDDEVRKIAASAAKYPVNLKAVGV